MMTQQQIDATAARIRELGVPDSLNRWLKMTPEALASNEVARARISRQSTRDGVRRVRSSSRSTLAAGHAANLDDAGKAILKDVRKAEREKKAERLARLRELKQERAMKPGPKEQQLHDQRVKATSEPKATAPAEPKTEATAAVEHKESAMSKTTKKTKTKAARTRVKADAKTTAVRSGSKLEIIVGMLKRPEGCTMADITAAVGWKTMSFPQQAKAANLTLRQKKEGKVTRYWAA